MSLQSLGRYQEIYRKTNPESWKTYDSPLLAVAINRELSNMIGAIKKSKVESGDQDVET
jgi:hypothetical protein